jgi:uncharacterized membrane protein
MQSTQSGAHVRRAPGQEPAGQVQRRPSRDIEQGGLTTLSSRRLRGVLLTSAFVLAAVPALAPAVLAADALSLTTPFPAVSVSPGNRVSFNLNVKTSSSARVDLSVAGVPSTWTAALHGGGFIVSAVQTSGTAATEVRLDVDVPADASGGTRITVTAKGNGATVDLPLDINAEANASGEVKVESDYESLRGSSSQPFTFNLNVSNQKDQDLTYSATGQGPDGWTVDAKLTGSAQAASATVKAGGTSGVTVTVTPADNAPADTYPVQVVTTVGGEAFTTDLTVEITGSYTLTVSTPDQVLSAHGASGSVTDQTFTITNTGTAPITNVTMSASPPSNWKVEFDPTTTDAVQPGQSVNVTGHITPSGDAIAGDYEINFSAKAKEATSGDSTTIRFTVEASILGAIVGAVLIVAAIGGLYWVFRRYGRR